MIPKESDLNGGSSQQSQLAARKTHVFLTCKEHQSPVNLYCEQCVSAICSGCKLLSHKSHTVMPLLQKIEEFRDKIKYVLSSNAEKVSGEESKLKKWKDMFDSSTKVAHECLEKLSLIIRNTIEKIGDTTKEQTLKFVEELKTMRQQHDDFQYKGLSILDNVEDDFIARAEDFLSTAKLPKIEGEWR